VSVQSSARKYANALYQVAGTNGTTAQVARDLAALVELLDAHTELASVFDTPLVPPSRKRALIESLLASAGDTTPEVSRLLLMLADRARLPLVREIAAAYTTRIQTAGRVMPAEIVTAVPIGPERQAHLAEALGRATGHQILLTSTVDADIVGGVVAKVGGVVYDGSVVRQLDRMKQKLSADA
jgi:F-type H+-transporting ATPase subunit delta